MLGVKRPTPAAALAGTTRCDPVMDAVDFVCWSIVSLVALAFLLPSQIVVKIYVDSTIVHLYRLYHYVRGAEEDKSPGSDFWAAPRLLIVKLWRIYGRIYYGYEVEGMGNIPEEGSALIVYYHGAIPIDYCLFAGHHLIERGRLFRSVADPFLLRVPGFTFFMQVMHVFSGSVENCVRVLNEGHLLSISPGGVREASFSDQKYQLVWGKRQGFAKVALEAKVSIIPVFTVNLREAFRSVTFGKTLFRKIYEKLRLPVVAVYGGLPVKLKTIVGKPIPYNPLLTADQVVQQTSLELQKLIATHQRIPGNMFKALLDRLH